MTEVQLQALADRLFEAEEKRAPVAAVSDSEPGMSIDDAYRVQLKNGARRLKSGARLIGYKIGLTSREAQKYFNLSEPDFGHLFDDMLIPEEGEISMAELIQPKIEGEVAFLIGKELRGPGVTALDVLSAVDSVMVSMEIIDSRISQWKIKATDTISDNGSSARLVVGSKRVALNGLDLPLMGLALSKNAEVQSTGAGAAVMGNPLNAVAFLANLLGRLDRCLLPGQLVLSGAVTAVLPVNAGEFYTCEAAKLGRIHVRATEGKVR